MREGQAMGIKDIVIAGAVRLPIGRFGGSLKDCPVYELGASAIRGLIERTGIDPKAIGEVILACNRLDGVGLNPARTAAHFAGVPESVPAHTVVMVCPAGLKALALATQAIRLGEAEVIVAGGMESMSNMPHILKGARFDGFRRGDIVLQDSFASLVDPTCGLHVGQIAELTAERWGISREEQDQYACSSHRKASQGWAEGVFANEVLPVMLPGKDGSDRRFSEDESYRPDVSLEKLARLPPAFENGKTVTAGNASGTTDGAAAVLITSRTRAAALGLKPMASFVGHLFMGVKPENFTDGPAIVIPRLLEKIGLALEDVDLLEVNEAFAAQILANEKVLQWNRSKLNVHGGAIALGHPTAFSGARMIVHLAHILKSGQLGLASLCGGQGIAGAMIIRGE
ncbi:MAG: thiolase family protein [Ardenticatenaceae bacterium]|nr:thiolase family protein [Ardenticatenaceae bacterium]